VISNRPLAGGLQQAKLAGLETRVIDHTGYTDREAFDEALQACIDSYQPALVVLAGFMRILTPGFVDHYRGRMLNIHPSLLPDLPGLNTHQRALDAGHSEHGASVHFVTEATDGGPVLLQARVAIHKDDSADSLAARVLQQEHRLYPQAIRWFAEGRIFLDENGHIQLDGSLLLSNRKPCLPRQTRHADQHNQEIFTANDSPLAVIRIAGSIPAGLRGQLPVETRQPAHRYHDD